MRFPVLHALIIPSQMLGLIQHFWWKTGHLITAESRVTSFCRKNSDSTTYKFSKRQSLSLLNWASEDILWKQVGRWTELTGEKFPCGLFLASQARRRSRGQKFQNMNYSFPNIRFESQLTFGSHKPGIISAKSQNAGLITVWSVCYQWCSQHWLEDFNDQQKQIVSNNHLTR